MLEYKSLRAGENKWITTKDTKKLIVFGKVKDFVRFIDISLGSLAELEFYFELTLELKYIDQTIYNEFQQGSLEVARLLRSFQKSLRAKVDR